MKHASAMQSTYVNVFVERAKAKDEIISKDGVSKQFSPFHQSPPLFLYSLSPLLSLPLFLSFIPGLSHTTTQTAASSHLLTDADDVGSGGGCAAGYYDTNNYATVHTLVSIPLIRCTLGRLIHLKLVSTCRAYRRRDGVLTYGVSSFEMQDTAQLLIKLSSCRYSR